MEYYTLEMKTNAAVNEDANFTNVEKLLIFVPQKSPTVFLGRPLGTAAFLNEVLTDIGWGGVGGGTQRPETIFNECPSMMVCDVSFVCERDTPWFSWKC